MMGTHSKLSPSSSAKWLNCTKSVEMDAAYANSSNSASTWGSETHLIGELLLKGENISVGDKLKDDEHKLPEFIVDDERLDCAVEYANYVRTFITDASKVLIEETFDLSFIAPETFGTGDATVLTNSTLHIFDLKTGRNKVYAKDNDQLKLYALGALEIFKDEYIDEVVLHIVQTRVGHIDTWEVSMDELDEFKMFAKQQAELIISGNTTYSPSEKACLWCKHKANCDALRKYAEDVIKGDFDELDSVDASNISTVHIKQVLDNKDLIISFIKAVEEEANKKLLNGEPIEGYKIVESRTNRKWSDENIDKISSYLTRKLKKDGAYKQTLITPTQAMKKLDEKERKYIEKYVVKPQGSPTVVKEQDKRKPLTAIIDYFD